MHLAPHFYSPHSLLILLSLARSFTPTSPSCFFLRVKFIFHFQVLVKKIKKYLFLFFSQCLGIAFPSSRAFIRSFVHSFLRSFLRSFVPSLSYFLIRSPFPITYFSPSPSSSFPRRSVAFLRLVRTLHDSQLQLILSYSLITFYVLCVLR